MQCNQAQRKKLTVSGVCWELEGKRKMGFRRWCGVRLYQKTASHVETRMEKGSRLTGSWELIRGRKQHNRDTPKCERSCTWQEELHLERGAHDIVLVNSE